MPTKKSKAFGVGNLTAAQKKALGKSMSGADWSKIGAKATTKVPRGRWQSEVARAKARRRAQTAKRASTRRRKR